MDKFSAIDKLQAEIKRLTDAYSLLEKIYCEHGPYRRGEISQKTWNEVRDYFKFDDSE